jgi:hypothetical protein
LAVKARFNLAEEVEIVKPPEPVIDQKKKR